MKKTLQFVFLQLLLLGLLFGGLMLYNNIISANKGEDKKIIIKHGDPGTDDLILDPPANSEVDVFKMKKVFWKIENQSNVDSFRIERKPSSALLVFLDPPSDEYAKDAKGLVGFIRRDGTIYNYNIFWKEKGDTTQHRFDPKLAVRSNTFALIEILIYFSYAVLFLLSFRLFRTAKK